MSDEHSKLKTASGFQILYVLVNGLVTMQKHDRKLASTSEPEATICGPGVDN